MAYVSGGYWFEVELVDNGGDVTKKRYAMTATTDEGAATDAAAILAAIQGVTDLATKAYHWFKLFVNDAFSFPASGVELQNQALLDMSIAGEPTKTATLTIPGPKATIFVGSAGPSAEVVDPADAAVIAFVALFQADNELTLSDGEVAGGLIKGRRIHRQSRSG